MQNGITIVEATYDEVVNVNALIPEFEAYDRAYFESRILGRDHLSTVGYFGKEAAGYSIWYDRDGDGSFYLWLAGVNPSFRRRGVLRAIVDHGFDWARSNGYQKIKVKTRNTRREMLSFLVRYGFDFTGVIPKEVIKENRIELEKMIKGA